MNKQNSMQKLFSDRKRKNNPFFVPNSSRSSQRNEGSQKRNFVKSEPVEYTNLVICGHYVKLPPSLEPYPTQRTMIAKILTSLNNRLNALIESPTGSGKTLGLLSSTCAWLAKYKEERILSRNECPACNKQIKAVVNNQDGEQCDAQNQDSSGFELDNEAKPVQPIPLNKVLINPVPLNRIMTLEEEFDSDFIPSPSSQKPKQNGTNSLSNDPKRRKLSLTPEDLKEPETSEGHSCLPRIAIYYGTRTHKQIGQVVKEFSRLPYGRDGILKHTILASREHSCINPAARTSGDINGKCKELITSDGIGCPFKNVMRPKYDNPSAVRRLISKNSETPDAVWDIEDLVNVLKISVPPICPYFSSTRVLITDADIIFCPFSYMIDPIIRTSSDVHLKNAIVILDEAHNVEDVCREAVSFSFTEKEIVSACADFRKKGAEVDTTLRKTEKKIAAQVGIVDEAMESRTNELEDRLKELSNSFEMLNKFAGMMLDWLVTVSSGALKKEPKNDRYALTYSWEALYNSLKDANFIQFDKLGKGTPLGYIRDSLEMVSGGKDLGERQTDFRAFKPNGASVVCVEKFVFFLKIYYEQEENRNCYKMFICIDKPFIPFGSSSRFGDDTDSSNADVLDMKVFRDGHEWLDSRSRLSGYTEIKSGYRVTLNLWCMRPALAYLDAFKDSRSVILASGTLCPTETFRSELGMDFQQQMEGSQVIPSENIFAAVIPAGPTGFHLCGTYKNINADNKFVNEISLLLRSVCQTIPKGVLCFVASYRLLDQIYEFMETEGILRQIQTIKHVLREPKRSSQMGKVMDDYEEAIDSPKSFGPQCTGALMFAVFRGKVSEGIDFSDDRARCVISVGIPFPNAMDEQVLEKKHFNDENWKKMGILSGNDWYTMQAYRALNQALGRCLRHRFDWGVILMVDERLRPGNPNSSKISKWIREELRSLRSYKNFIEELTGFVASMQSQQLSGSNNTGSANCVPSVL